MKNDNRITGWIKMIVFDLKCGNNHIFEGWFEDSGAFEEQSEAGMISCPVCNDTFIAKAPSSFAIKTFRPQKTKADLKAGIEKMARQLNDYVQNNFDDVGCEFSNEALKIHYGASEARNIRGTSTEKEEENLKKEGIQFLKIPGAPPDPDIPPDSE